MKSDFSLCLPIIVTILLVFGVVRGSELSREEVTVIETAQRCVAVETEDGNIYQFYGDGYNAGEKHIIWFNNRGTADRTDDEILFVR